LALLIYFTSLQYITTLRY